MTGDSLLFVLVGIRFEFSYLLSNDLDVDPPWLQRTQGQLVPTLVGEWQISKSYKALSGM